MKIIFRTSIYRYYKAYKTIVFTLVSRSIMMALARNTVVYLLFASTLYISCTCDLLPRSCGTVKESLRIAGSVLDNFTPGMITKLFIIIAQQLSSLTIEADYAARCIDVGNPVSGAGVRACHDR